MYVANPYTGWRVTASKQPAANASRKIADVRPKLSTANPVVFFRAHRNQSQQPPQRTGMQFTKIFGSDSILSVPLVDYGADCVRPGSSPSSKVIWGAQMAAWQTMAASRVTVPRLMGSGKLDESMMIATASARSGDCSVSVSRRRIDRVAVSEAVCHIASRNLPVDILAAAGVGLCFTSYLRARQVVSATTRSCLSIPSAGSHMPT